MRKSWVLTLPMIMGCAINDDGTDETLSTTSQMIIGDTQTIISGLSPVGYWRLGDPFGAPLMNDITSYDIDGSYSGVVCGQPGAVHGDRDTACNFDGRLSMAEVGDHKIYSLTRDWDFFGTDLFGDPPPGFSWGYAPDGELWAPQVSNGNYYYITTAGTAMIDPKGQAGTFQQARNTSLLGGEMQIRVSWSKRASGGPLQPLSLVAQATDLNNFVRVELLENANHSLTLNLIKTVNGVNQYLASAPVPGGENYVAGDWWYVRFHFDGTYLAARAWKKGFPESNAWIVEATTSSAVTGYVAVRSANSASNARPIVQFDDFWVQTLGFSVSVFLKSWAQQPSLDVGKTFPFGKADKDDAGGLHDDDEYYFRYEPVAGSNPAVGHLKGYVFNLGGGLGAGVDAPNLVAGNWYHVVFMLDPGDELDHYAGAHMYVNGVELPAGSGSRYWAQGGCATACVSNSCNDINGVPQSCWAITPLNGDSSVWLGRAGGVTSNQNWGGMLDELAIFSRKLTAGEIKKIYNSACLIPEDPGNFYAPVAVQASSIEGAGVEPDKAADRNWSTRWSSAWSDPQWITFDLGAVKDVARVRLYWETAYASAYSIMVSNDNVVFTTAASITNGDGGIDDVDVFRSARYVRMTGTTRATQWGYSLWEMEVTPCGVAPP